MQARPYLSGVVETSLYVADLDAARGFYERVMGFRTVMRDQRMCALAVAPSNVLLLFRRGGSTHPSPTPFGDIPAHDGHGQLHLCFAVPRQAIEDWARYLPEQGVAIESRLEWPNGGISLYFRDLDRHSIEVATSGLWPNF